MNGNNQYHQINRAARINFSGEPETVMASPVYESDAYRKAFYSVTDDYCNEYCFNTTSWD